MATVVLILITIVAAIVLALRFGGSTGGVAIETTNLSPAERGDKTGGGQRSRHRQMSLDERAGAPADIVPLIIDVGRSNEAVSMNSTTSSVSRLTGSLESKPVPETGRVSTLPAGRLVTSTGSTTGSTTSTPRLPSTSEVAGPTKPRPTVPSTAGSPPTASTTTSPSTTGSESSSSTGPVVTTSTTSTTAGHTSTTATATTTVTTVVTTTTTSTVVAPPPTDPTAIWEEHFNSLDTSRWVPEYSTYGDGNGELQCYRPENVKVTGGRLVLTAKSEHHTCPRDRQRDHTSGMVRSRGLTFSPGQAIEFRVKLTPADPSDQAGLWPAVWASSWAGGSWPRGGELDWLEVMTAEDPKRSVFSMHYADRSGHHELQNKAVPMAGNFSDSWHTIRFEYGFGGRLTWYLDGQQVFLVSGADTIQGYPAPFDQTISEIKINLALGGTPGPLNPAALGSSGATFEVDYIKVFAL